MSNVNVKRLVDNIRSGTNIYTPLVELIVNAIQSIDEKGTKDGLVEIEVLRDRQASLDNPLGDVEGFIVKDNGIGFTQKNRLAYDTLYTENKITDGGKGFGRFTSLKYFDQVKVLSTFLDGDIFRDRSFKMGLGNEIIVDEKISESKIKQTGATVEISGIRSIHFQDKKLETISRVVVERLLPYFVDKERQCPRIVIRDAQNRSEALLLNDYLGKEDSQIIEMKVKKGDFSLPANNEEKTFQIRVFKFYAPRTAKSKISLVAHRREVTDNPIQNYIPEFEQEFYESSQNEDSPKERNFVLKAYVFGDYLNDNVSLERGEFRFPKDPDLMDSISQTEIEQKAAEIAKSTMGTEIAARKKRKEERIAEYIASDAPWHNALAKEVDFSTLPMQPSKQEIELYLQKKKYEKEINTRTQVTALLKSDNPNELTEKISQIVESISDTSKNDLIHYVSMRKCVLDLLSKSLELDANGKYKSEGDVHDIIMPRRKDSEEIDYSAHNLWILDERLNFSNYVSSEKPLNKSNGDRTDITVFNRRVAFRGDNEASNPITIFEFKRPQRDDFTNPSSDEDPVQQIVRYVNQIRDGKFKTPTGRDIIVTPTTPFYGYVVCDLTAKVKKWLEVEKDFTTMPDGLGWFKWFGNISLYVEVISWTKLLRDAEMRNKIFFNKLGID